MPEDDDKLSDAELFRSAIGDVQPLKNQPRVSPSKTDVNRKPWKQPGSAGSTPFATNPSDENLAPVAMDEPLSFSRPGVQNQWLRRLKRGAFRPDDTLDLHGLNQDQAAQTLQYFLGEQTALGHRVLLIIHGKGLHGEDRWPVLKNLTHRILRQYPSVLAIQSAQPRDGGLGAVYVLLKRQND